MALYPAVVPVERSRAVRWLAHLALASAALWAAGCGSPGEPGTAASADSHADGSSDTSVLFDAAGLSDVGGSDLTNGDQVGLDEKDGDAASPDAEDSSLADAVTAADTADVVANCPGGPGCPCADNKECDLLVCLDTPGGKVCAQNGTTSCPKDYVCIQFSGGGGDSTNLCAPQYGWRCEPCTASSQCSAPGQAAAVCVVYGTQGAFCGSTCTQDSDCGPGFACQTAKTIEGTTSKQCVVLDDKNALPECPCSKRAVKLGLSTTCSNPSGGAFSCSGKRTCTSAGMGGMTACDAPQPATETCNGADDDCNGATDEVGCDDGNPCTKDACDAAKKECTHSPEVGVICDDGDPCTLGDVCKNGSCAGGLKACECQQDGDCAGQEDGNLCNGTLFCDTATLPYKCKPKANSAVVCDTQADTACKKATCVPSTGQCALAPVPNGTSCDDGSACTGKDECVAGACKPGPMVVTCCNDSDCMKKEDGNLCNGTLYCDTTSMPYVCMVKPSTIVTCDTSADTTCSKATCDSATGQCKPVAVQGPVSCDDSDPCTVGDVCASGLCSAGTNICECQKDSDCAGKEDGNLCNGTLYCNKDAAPYKCQLKAGTVVTCDTSGDTTCSKTTCDTKTGKCAPVPVSGAVCDDGNPCTAGDACKAGTCESGSSICGCQQDSDCAAKEDGDLCNGTLYCDKGKIPYACAVDSKTIVTCDASGDTTCAKAACDAKTGKCAAKPVSNGVTCSDGSACTGPDQCTNGQCAGQAADCDDKNPCSNDSCDPKTGCVHANNTNPCSDGNACTLGDVCAGGTCSAGSPPSCSDGLKNGGEIDKDCGGASTCGLPACPSCPTGAVCVNGSDCASKVCQAGHCAFPTCNDQYMNGKETDIDCGGPECSACPTVLLVATGGATVAGELTKAGVWKTQSFPAPSVSAPSVVGGTTYGMAALRYTKPADLQDNQVQVMQWTYAGWTAPSVLGSDITTKERPSLARIGSNALLVFHGNDFKYYSMAFTGSWTPVAVVGTPQAFGPKGPALAGLGTSALLTYIDGNNSNHLAGKVYSGSWGATLDGGGGPDFNVAPAALGIGAGSALAVYSKSSGAAAFHTFASGAWSGAADVPQVWTKYTVSLARDGGGNVWMAFHGTDDKLYVTSYSKGAWSAPSQVVAAGAIESTPAVAQGLLGSIELAWVDKSGAVWHSTLNGATWSTPKQVATGAQHVALAHVP
ncbi:MAG: hypothetical protein HY902_08170 [Deltaproteobacteria bacterium]|nr:hypothetical protein [Deltaproteobacteria bacterium]